MTRATRPYAPAKERFWRFVEPGEPDACWPWTGAIHRNGYGRFGAGGPVRMQFAHRFAYELLVGPIGAGLVIDHLCRNRRCVNPAHLEPVTQRENLYRGAGWVPINAAKTHCKNGHAFDEANTYVNAKGWRYCRACNAARRRDRLAKLRAAS